MVVLLSSYFFVLVYFWFSLGFVWLSLIWFDAGVPVYKAHLPESTLFPCEICLVEAHLKCSAVQPRVLSSGAHSIFLLLGKLSVNIVLTAFTFQED